MRTITKIKLVVLFLIMVGNFNGKVYSQTSYDYAEALQKSLFFYESQQSGTLSSTNRNTWRASSGMTDGSDVDVDLTGGWYDAGDHVKFGFPMAYTATMLGWGAIDFQSGYEKSGQLTTIKNNLRFVYDYFIKCHTAPNELYGQVGNGSTDHAFWGAPEIMKMDRPSYKIDASNPGTDLAMETAAALAAGSMLFATEDPEYSATLLAHAKELYTFGDTYRGKYSDAITDATSYYNSWSGYTDELVWGAIWLYRATNDATYLTAAETAYESLSYEGQSTDYKAYKWTINWDDKTYGCYALLAKLTGESKYYDDIERNLDYWTTGFNGETITYTPGGLAWLQQWGSLRYSSNASFLALYYGDLPLADATKKTTYSDFAKTQIDYALGANPDSRSYVCGFGTNPPINPHHRGAHGTWTNSLTGLPTDSRHTLYGALVGGPDVSDDYTDSRSDYIKNEVATDYNSGFSGALARLIEDEATVTIPDDIPTETVGEEYLTTIKSNSTGTSFFEPAIKIKNHTAWPARQPDKLSFRYFIDISEGVSEGYTISDYSVALGGYAPDATLVSGFTKWSDNIYYVEVEYNDVEIYPGGESESYRECQFRITGPSTVTWNNDNDFSYTGVTTTEAQTSYVPVYENGVKVYGNEPSGSTTVNYTVTASVGSNGTISPSGVTTVVEGGSQTYTITPSTGYQVDDVSVNGVSVGAVTTYTFTDVAADQTIAVTFKEATTYSITATAGNNGTISPSGVTKVTEGSSQIYTITPSTGYQVDDVTVDGISVGTVTTYTFANVAADQTIAVTFKEATTYAITATVGDNGTISPSGVTTVTEGSSQTYTITPSTDYQVDDVTVNGVSVGAVTTYTFTNVTADQTIAATFKEVATYTIAATAGDNGTISPSGDTTVTEGSSQTYTITASTGYQVADVTVNGVSVGAVSTYTFSSVAADQTIAVTFEEYDSSATCLLTTFDVPRSTALPSTNSTFKYVYVLGTDGPSVSTISMATFNWDLTNNGLYDFSFNFSASPWYSGFSSTTVKNLNGTSPSVTIQGSGVTNFDNNQYYVNLVGDDVVFVEVSGSHAVYFSNSATSPVDCSATSTAKSSSVTLKQSIDIQLYPNPVTDVLTVSISNEATTKEITLYDLLGVVVYQKSIASGTLETQIDMSKLSSGVYVLVYKADGQVSTKKVVRK